MLDSFKSNNIINRQNTTKKSGSRVSMTAGYNVQHIKQHNRLLVLNQIAIDGPISRVELSKRVGLTKTALGKIVSDLIAEGLVCESIQESYSVTTTLGRKPILLRISDTAPCICGILIKRKFCSVILADMSGKIFDQTSLEYEKVSSAQQLISMLVDMFNLLKGRNNRKIFAIGISCIGPVDVHKGSIANPPNFFGIKDVPICDILQQETGLPCFIINDANAGALAEKMYGSAKNINSFIYVHIMNGIGSGYVLDNKIYNGLLGQSGEIGHQTINFNGPECACGNVGCLELYANLQNMNRRIREMQKSYDHKNTLVQKDKEYTLEEILDAVDRNDSYAIAAVDEFCEYLALALTSLINILNVNYIIVGYDRKTHRATLEKVLENKIKDRSLIAKSMEIQVKRSVFMGDAPLYGAIAAVMERIFTGLDEKLLSSFITNL